MRDAQAVQETSPHASVLTWAGGRSVSGLVCAGGSFLEFGAASGARLLRGVKGKMLFVASDELLSTCWSQLLVSQLI